MAKKFYIKLNKDKCIGCGSCSVLCEKYFEMDENGLSHLKKSNREGEYEILGSKEEPLKEDYESTKEAEESCPVNAIEVVELDEKD